MEAIRTDSGESGGETWATRDGVADHDEQEYGARSANVQERAPER